MSRVCLVILNAFSQRVDIGTSEICDAEVIPAVDKEVFRLQVPVDNSRLVHSQYTAGLEFEASAGGSRKT